MNRYAAAHVKANTDTNPPRARTRPRRAAWGNLKVGQTYTLTQAANAIGVKRISLRGRLNHAATTPLPVGIETVKDSGYIVGIIRTH